MTKSRAGCAFREMAQRVAIQKCHGGSGEPDQHNFPVIGLPSEIIVHGDINIKTKRNQQTCRAAASSAFRDTLRHHLGKACSTALVSSMSEPAIENLTDVVLTVTGTKLRLETSQ